jgi:hypothetical protein
VDEDVAAADCAEDDAGGHVIEEGYQFKGQVIVMGQEPAQDKMLDKGIPAENQPAKQPENQPAKQL